MNSPDIYLLDTHIVSSMMRDPAGIAAQRVLSAVARGHEARVCTSIVVQCELLFGLRRTSSSRWNTHYERVMATLDVLPLDASVSAPYAELRTQLESAGTPIGPNDTFIAAHALALGATLISSDVEFERVPGLQVENWLQQQNPNT